MVFVVPCLRGHPLPSLSPMFVLQAIHPPSHSSSLPFILPLFIGMAVRCCGCTCGLSSWCLLSSAFVVPAVCCPPFVATIIVSTSNSPYEQWLVGGLVVLYDVAVAGAAEVLGVLCCCCWSLPCKNRTCCCPASRGSQWQRMVCVVQWVGDVIVKTREPKRKNI